MGVDGLFTIIDDLDFETAWVRPVFGVAFLLLYYSPEAQTVEDTHQLFEGGILYA